MNPGVVLSFAWGVVTPNYCQRHGGWCPCPGTCPCWYMRPCDDGGERTRKKYRDELRRLDPDVDRELRRLEREPLK